MRDSLFEDLVVSVPGRRGDQTTALVPALLIHGLALAGVLALPRIPATPADVPKPEMRWPVTSAAPGGPVRASVITPARGPRRSAAPSAVPSVVTPPTAAAPADVASLDPSSLPDPGESAAPCLQNCDSAATGPAAEAGGEGPGAPEGGGDGSEASRPLRISGGVESPQRIRYVAPVFPPLALQARIGGVVVLECTIDREGRVIDIGVLAGHPLLTDAAVQAVRQWTYTPTRLGGVPVPVIMTVTVRFVVGR